jgi:hypothetical protein
MLGGNMDSERLRMQKLLLAGWTTKRQMPLMLFHMIMHGVLVLFYLRTDSADKLARSILLISVRHLCSYNGGRSLQFFIRYLYGYILEEMSNTNKSCTWNTQTLNIRTSTNFSAVANAAVNNGTVRVTRRGDNANRTSSAQVQVQPLLTVVLTAIAVPGPGLDPGPSIPPVTTGVQYIVFTVPGLSSWTAPATCQSPIDVILVGGGGGGGGAAVQDAAAGGGGAGQVKIFTFTIVPGTTYNTLVGSGGRGGRASATGNIPNPVNGTGFEEDGVAGNLSTFNGSGTPSFTALGGSGGFRWNRSSHAGGGDGGAAATPTAGGGPGEGTLSPLSKISAGGGGGAVGIGGNGAAATNPSVGGAGYDLSYPTISSVTTVRYGIGGDGGLYRATGPGVNGQDAVENTGSGGGGGTTGLGGAASGGKGANGAILIRFTTT